MSFREARNFSVSKSSKSKTILNNEKIVGDFISNNNSVIEI